MPPGPMREIRASGWRALTVLQISSICLGVGMGDAVVRGMSGHRFHLLITIGRDGLAPFSPIRVKERNGFCDPGKSFCT